MRKVRRYGRNQWKIHVLNSLTILLILGACGTGGVCLYPKVNQILIQRKEKERIEEEKKVAEKEAAEREAAKKEAEEKEAAKKEAEEKEAAKKEAAEKEAAKKEAEEKEAAEKEAAEKEAAEKEKAEKEAAEKEKAEKEKAEKEKAEKEKAEREKAEKEAAEKKAQEEAEKQKQSEYILPNSDKVYLTREDIKGLSLREINYAKNELYARRGRLFDSEELRQYFGSKSWYRGTISPDSFNSNVFNDYERKNIDLLAKVEREINPNGYALY